MRWSEVRATAPTAGQAQGSFPRTPHSRRTRGQQPLHEATRGRSAGKGVRESMGWSGWTLATLDVRNGRAAACLSDQSPVALRAVTARGELREREVSPFYGKLIGIAEREAERPSERTQRGCLLSHTAAPEGPFPNLGLRSPGYTPHIRGSDPPVTYPTSGALIPSVTHSYPGLRSPGDTSHVQGLLRSLSDISHIRGSNPSVTHPHPGLAPHRVHRATRAAFIRCHHRSASARCQPGPLPLG